MSTTDETRLNFRLPAELKETIEEAATHLGQSVTDFAVSTLVRNAREVIEQLPRLKLIVFSGLMNAALDHKAAAERNIIVCNAFGMAGNESASGGGPAELSLALMLAWTGGAVRAQAFDAAGLYAVPLEDGQRLPGLAVVRP